MSVSKPPKKGRSIGSRYATVRGENAERSAEINVD
jgi:hypothetical protein